MPVILVVDDDRDSLNLIKRYLSLDDYQVFSANNAFEAQEIINKYRVNLMLVDINMPFQNGFDFVEQVKRSVRNRFLPISFLTGRQDRRDIERAARLKVNDYMLKPLQKEDFLKKVKKLISQSEAVVSEYETIDLKSRNISGEVIISYSFVIEAISEIGVTVLTSFDVGDLENQPEKVVEISGLLWGILDIQPFPLTVGSKQRVKESNRWRLQLLFKEAQPAAMEKIKRWIAKAN